MRGIGTASDLEANSHRFLGERFSKRPTGLQEIKAEWLGEFDLFRLR